MEDRSLDEFLSDSGGASDGETSGSGETDADGKRDETGEPGKGGGTATVEPATPTSDWTPDGTACADCGTTVRRRWQAGDGDEDGDGMICSACKEW